jgi:GTP-binding protein
LDAPRLEARFLKSAATFAQCPPPAGPEIAFAGRSNAGKSSVLNRLTGSRRTAKVSKSPGRTQLLNFFDVTDGGRLVDLPGYGYAQAARSAQAGWQRTVNEYLSHREVLAGVVLVMDIRHPLRPFDEQMLAWCAAAAVPCHVLLTKADKLKRGPARSTLLKVRKALPGGATAQVFSARKPEGLDELIERLNLWYGLDEPTGNKSGSVDRSGAADPGGATG